MSTVDSPIEELRPVDVAPARHLTEKAGTAIAFALLVFVDLVVRLSGFRRFHEMMRRWPTIGNPPKRAATTEKITRAVDRAATYYFKRAWCLQRSATAVCLLRLRGIDARLVIGAQKIPFAAHAWAEVGGRVVNDHPMIQKSYTALERC